MGNFLHGSRKLVRMPYLTATIFCALTTNSFAVTSSTLPTAISNTGSMTPTAQSTAYVAPSQGGGGNTQICVTVGSYKIVGGSPTNQSTVSGSVATPQCTNMTYDSSNNPQVVSVAFNPSDNCGPSGGYPGGCRTWSRPTSGVVTGGTSQSWPDSGSGIYGSALPISDAWGTSPPNYCAYQSYSNPITDYWMFNANGTYNQTMTMTVTNNSAVNVQVSIGAEACCYVGGPPSWVVITDSSTTPATYTTFGNTLGVGAGQTVTGTFMWGTIGTQNADGSYPFTPGIQLNSGYEYSQRLGVRFTPASGFSGA